MQRYLSVFRPCFCQSVYETTGCGGNGVTDLLDVGIDGSERCLPYVSDVGTYLVDGVEV